MARKKATSPGKAGGPQGKPRKKNLVVIKGFETWGQWLEKYAAHKGMPVTVLIDYLLRESARRDGFAEPPPRY